MDDIEKTIDIEKLVRSSGSVFIRSLPKIIIKLISGIVQEEEMNATIHRSRDKEGVPFINSVLKDWNVGVVVKGEENIPEKGRFVFAANHPVGGLDALSLFSTVYRHYPGVVFPSNELFKYIPQLKPVLLGINVFGKNTRETAEKINGLFASSSQILYFPAGEVSRRNKGKISDIQWQKSFITKAIEYERDIIPVHISGRNSNLFYNVARIRKMLGIKTYLETMLLPREMMLQRNSVFTITIGSPLPWQSFTKNRSHLEWAQYVKDIVYELGKNNSEQNI